MKKFFFFILILLLPQNIYAKTNIAFLDVKFIIDNSNLGVFYGEKLKKIENKNTPILKEKQSLLKDKEIEINNQKNILKPEQIELKVKELNSLINDYKLIRSKFNQEISLKKKEYTEKILSILNPILTNYVEKNNIDLVLEKKNILVGIKTLDITKELLDIFNAETQKLEIINDK